MTWVYEIRGLDDTPLAEMRPRARRLIEGLNGAGAFSFQYHPDEVPDEIVVGERDIVVSHQGRYAWRGQILGAQPSVDQTQQITFAALGVLDLLADRYVPPGFEILATEATTMAWQLIQYTQGLVGGDLGVVAGSLPTSVARSKTWDTWAQIRQEIEALATLDNGFDYSLEPHPTTGQPTFECYYPRRGGDTGVVLELGRNITSVRAQLDQSSGRFANHVYSVGADGVTVEVSDPVSTGRFRRREHVVTSNDVDDVTLLGDRGRGVIGQGIPSYLPTLELAYGAPDAEYGAIGLGDTVEVSVLRGWWRLDGEYRVVGRETTWPGDGDVEAIAVTVEAV